LIQLEFKRFAAFWTREGDNAVPHQNSVMHDLVKQVPWDRFEELVRAHGADVDARKLTTKRQFLALLYAQLSGASSLREIETGMASHAMRFYHLAAERCGARPCRRPIADVRLRCSAACWRH
jgi:hypothetical protein